MINFNEAITILNNLNIKILGVEKIFILDTDSRILAEDIIAKENSPAYPTSSMDGYAIKFSDQKLKKIKVIDKLPAGSFKEFNLQNGEAIKIYTGSIIPKGADSVIPIELVTFKDNEITINQEVKESFSIRSIGENFSQDEVLIKKGNKIGFAEIGVMASLNIAEVLIYKQPTLSVISTGSEILGLCDKESNPSQIRSSNNYTVSAIAKKYGANILNMGVIKDDRENIEKYLNLALESSDIVVTTGGVSVGDFDFVKEIVKSKGELIFDRVNMKPGQHIKIVKVDNKFILALPGFAYSSTITFLLFGLNLIQRMQGGEFKFKTIKAILKEPFIKRSKKTEFSTCNIEYIDNNYYVNFKNKKVGSSAILTNMLGENLGLIVSSESDESKNIGDSVKVILLNQ